MTSQGFKSEPKWFPKASKVNPNDPPRPQKWAQMIPQGLKSESKWPHKASNDDNNNDNNDNNNDDNDDSDDNNDKMLILSLRL